LYKSQTPSTELSHKSPQYQKKRNG